jgi:hypothetical protein
MTGLIFIVLSALVLAACAAPNVDQSAVDFDAITFAVDLNLCRGGNFTEASLKTIDKGALGLQQQLLYRRQDALPSDLTIYHQPLTTRRLSWQPELERGTWVIECAHAKYLGV